MKILHCKCGSHILIDDEDFNLVSGLEWTCSNGGNVYHHVGTGSEKVSISLASMILGVVEGKLVDHKDNDKHDNRKQNLRQATRSQNGANRRLNKNNQTGFKGVSLNLGKWCAKIRFNGKDIWLGYHDTPTDAARAYDKKAKELFGEFALLNNV